MDFTVYPGSRIARLPRLLHGPALALRNVTRAWHAVTSNGRTASSHVPRGFAWAGDGLATSHFSPFLVDARFNDLYARMVEHWSLGRSDLAPDVRWRLWVLTSLARGAAHLPGAFAEFGVFRGGFAFMILATSPPLRHGFYLFDTFEGIPASHLTEAEEEHQLAGRGYETSVEDVSHFLAAWHDDIRIVKGDVFETLSRHETGPLAFCHVDLNVAAATRVALEYAYPRLLPGATMVFDDYGWSGYEDQRHVIDQFFSNRPEPLVALPTGQAAVFKH
jgi:O-methyltransferase